MPQEFEQKEATDLTSQQKHTLNLLKRDADNNSVEVWQEWNIHTHSWDMGIQYKSDTLTMTAYFNDRGIIVGDWL